MAYAANSCLLVNEQPLLKALGLNDSNCGLTVFLPLLERGTHVETAFRLIAVVDNRRIEGFSCATATENLRLAGEDELAFARLWRSLSTPEYSTRDACRTSDPPCSLKGTSKPHLTGTAPRLTVVY